MSKAFTSEEPESAEVESAPPLVLPPGTRNYLTPSGHQRQLQEKARLDGRLAELDGALLRGKAQGLPPAEVEALDRERRSTARRFDALRQRLELAEVVDPAATPPGTPIRFGAVVDLEDEAGRTRTVAIVGIDEAEPALGRVSWLSPWARALLGREPGEEVTLRVPKGEERWEITAVRWG